MSDVPTLNAQNGGNGGNGGTNGPPASSRQIEALTGSITARLEAIGAGVQRLEGEQRETRSELGQVRSDVGNIKERLIVVETTLKERDRSQALVDAADARARVDAKEAKQGVATWVMWVGAAMITLLAALLSAIATTWVTAAHK